MSDSIRHQVLVSCKSPTTPPLEPGALSRPGVVFHLLGLEHVSIDDTAFEADSSPR